jgi:hypothetical protein
LNPDSYKLDQVIFKEICLWLYNYGKDNYSKKNNINFQKLKFEEIVKNLMNSEIENLLKEFDFKNKNETLTVDGKPRQYNDNFMINEKYSTNTDYYDKLDNL